MNRREFINNLVGHTNGVTIEAEDAQWVRRVLGAQIDGERPDWWLGMKQSTRRGGKRLVSPYRVFPDFGHTRVHIVWLKAIDSEIRELVDRAFPDAQTFRNTFPKPVDSANAVWLEILEPMFYTVPMLRFMERTGPVDMRVPPNLNYLVPYVRDRLISMMYLWHRVPTPTGLVKRARFIEDQPLQLLRSNGEYVTREHVTLETGHTLKCTGYIGPAIYTSSDNEVMEAAKDWLYAASMWGLSSGSTWGWSTIWTQYFEEAGYDFE